MYLASIRHAFFIPGAYHVAGDLFGQIAHFLAVFVGYDGHVDFLQDVGRFFPFSQSAPSDHRAFFAFVRRVRCLEENKNKKKNKDK